MDADYVGNANSSILTPRSPAMFGRRGRRFTLFWHPGLCKNWMPTVSAALTRIHPLPARRDRLEREPVFAALP